MKKILLFVLLFTLSFSSLFAHNHGEMNMEDKEFGVFTEFVKDDLTETEKKDLKILVKMQEDGMNSVMEIVKKVKAGELNNFEEFSKIVPKRKAMMEKLKTYMKNPEDFEYMCMNHGDELIAKLFTDEMMVLNYKKKFESKLKSKIENFYFKKGKSLEKTIHKLYHKNIDSKKIKNISSLRALELIIEDIKSDNKFGDVSKFIKTDLTNTQEQGLMDLLKERSAAQAKFKKMLSEAKVNGNFEEVFEIVKNKRAGCQARFELYISEDKKEEFKTHCTKMGEKLKASFGY